MDKKKSNVNVKLDADVKEQASQLFAKMGLDQTTAIDMFFRQVIAERRLPFQPSVDRRESNTDYENNGSVYPLSYYSGFFKGMKPTSVIFGGKKVPAYTWRMVVKEVMSRCNADPENHKNLMKLRNNLSGRTRAFLSSSRKSMRNPLEVEKGLYLETHYDTETLLRILLHRVLDSIHYDYSDIYVTITDRQPLVDDGFQERGD